MTRNGWAKCYLCGRWVHLEMTGHEVIGVRGNVRKYRHRNVAYCRERARQAGRKWKPSVLDIELRT